MTVTATSSLALAVQGLIDLIAESTTFQNRVATYHSIAASEANARLHIYGFDQFDNIEGSRDMRPFAIVGVAQHIHEAVAMCSQIQHNSKGTLILTLVDNARYTDTRGDDPADDYNDSYIDFCNFVGGVLDGLNGAALEDAAFPPYNIETIVEPSRPPVVERETDDHWIAIYSVSFGEEANS